VSTAEPQTAESQRRFPWRFLLPVPLLLLGLGWWGLQLPEMHLEQLREQLVAELTESSARADVIAIAGTPSNSMSVTATNGTVERESVSYGPERTWLSELGVWAKRTFRGKDSLRISMPVVEVRWHAGRCLGVCEPGDPWPDNTPGLEWPIVER
jgi:hypothetical protein